MEILLSSIQWFIKMNKPVIGVIGNHDGVRQTLSEMIKSNDPDYQIVLDEEPYIPRKRVCCNCGNNKRIKDDKGMVIENRCAIDNHYIGYCECFDHWCNRWRKERN